MTTHLHVGAALCALVMLALTGCGDSREPSHLETPAVVWPDGEVTGAFPDEPAAQAVQDYAIAFAVAWNAVDYSDPALVELIGIDQATEAAQFRQDKRETTTDSSPYFSTRPGPWPLLVIDVIHDQDTTLVVVCGRDLDVTSGFPVYYYKAQVGESGEYRLTEVPDYIAVSSEDALAYPSKCVDAGVPEGLFEPTPTSDPEADVVFPADASKYDLD